MHHTTLNRILEYPGMEVWEHLVPESDVNDVLREIKNRFPRFEYSFIQSRAGFTFQWEGSRFINIQSPYPGFSGHKKWILNRAYSKDGRIRSVPRLREIYPKHPYIAGIPTPQKRGQGAWLMVLGKTPILHQSRLCLRLEKYFRLLWNRLSQKHIARLHISSRSLSRENQTFASLIHQVKEPLNRLERELKYFQPPLTTKPVSPDFSEISRQVAATRKFIGDFLWLSRQKKMPLSRMDLHRSLKDLELHYRHDTRFRWVELQIIAPEQPLYIRGHAAILFHVFQNLVENALKALGSHGTITLECRAPRPQTKSGIQIDVTDSGPGIPGDLTSQLFSLSKPNTGGSGWGLWICQRIMEYHSGNIGYEPSQAEIPGCFRLKFPADKG